MPTLADLDLVFSIGLWGYDLRGSWVMEFSATIAEGHDFHGYEWDRPEWRLGELWHGEERQPIPYTWALPWVSDIAPAGLMYRRDWRQALSYRTHQTFMDLQAKTVWKDVAEPREADI